MRKILRYEIVIFNTVLYLGAHAISFAFYFIFYHFFGGMAEVSVDMHNVLIYVLLLPVCIK